jgi:hypothetical protein
MSTVMKRPLGLMVVVVLVIVQGVLALLRANQWFQVGIDLLGEGVLFIPLMGLVAIGRGRVVAGIGILYVLFAVGRARWEKLGMVDGINCSIDECVPCLKPSSSGSTSRSLAGLGYRSGDPTLLPFQTLSVALSGFRS